MSKDLTNSGIARQNILNNQYALQEIQKSVGISGILFENEFRFTKKQIAAFFEVSGRTINKCLAENEAELSKNGYEVVVGKRLTDFKLVVQYHFDPEMDFMIKTPTCFRINLKRFVSEYYTIDI